MQQPKRELTLIDVQHYTHFNRQALQDWIRRAERAFADLDRGPREDEQTCRWCFYAVSSRVGGAAMTEKPCDSCSEVMLFSSTITDRLCKPCGKRLGLCVRCSADIDLVDRRKLERGR
jgi:hypothetical protein